MSNYVSVTIDVDISEFDDEDLISEIESRSIGAFDIKYELTEMFYAFKLGKQDRAMEIAKQISSNHMGMIL